MSYAPCITGAEDWEDVADGAWARVGCAGIQKELIMTERKPANENPWYVLMTLYGEQEGKWVDVDLAKKNQRVWNAWACQGLSDEERARICANSGRKISELLGWTEMEAEVRDRHRGEMIKRGGYDRGFPEVHKRIDLSKTDFSNMVWFQKFIFTQDVVFRLSKFIKSAHFSSAVFLREAEFCHCTFKETANFRIAGFMQTAGFNDVNFNQEAIFDGVQFLESAYFENTNFEKSADFERTFFTMESNFRASKFEGPAKFVSAKFGQRVGPEVCEPVFSEATFLNIVSFRDAVFAPIILFCMAQRFWPRQ